MYSGKELNKSSVKVLDVGAGSGLSGIALREAGFSGTIDALEPSEMMFAQAKPKNIYTQYFSDFLIGAQVLIIVLFFKKERLFKKGSASLSPVKHRVEIFLENFVRKSA